MADYTAFPAKYVYLFIGFKQFFKEFNGMLGDIKKRLNNFLSDKQREIQNKYGKISYSQCGEDLIVDFIFKIRGISLPSYMDIGAHQPYYINNTYLFYSRGATGINIEPDPTLFKDFITERPKDINLNIGIGAQSAKQEFYIMSSSTLNTFSKKEAEALEKNGQAKITNTTMIQLEPVSTIINQHWNNSFPDFLSIDVEGLETDILESIDFKASAPKVICVETFEYSSGKNKTELMELIKDNNYDFHSTTAINSIFIHKDFN